MKLEHITYTASLIACGAMIAIALQAGIHGDFFWMAISLNGALGWGLAMLATRPRREPAA